MNPRMNDNYLLAQHTYRQAHKIIFRIICLLFISLPGKTFAQADFTYWDSIPVSQWGHNLLFPSAGGFNNPQFSTIDLNGDGIMDLFVFERSTNRVYTFLNAGIPGQPSYSYAPQYRNRFPEGLDGWVLLRDFNCDGKKDLFCSKNNSFAVYRNDYDSLNGLHFTFVTSFSQIPFYIIPADIPAITDIDDDNDLDIVTFDGSGVFMYLFKNLSEENYGTCDSLEFTIDQHCWGSFSENFFTCDVLLGDTNSPCISHNGPIHPETQSDVARTGLHPGNASLILDLNGDGKKDLILGPQVCSDAYMLTNCINPGLDSMIAQTQVYPDISHPISFNLFPATYYEDVNNDSRKDLLAAPNRSASEDTASSWLFHDTSSTAVPSFSFVKKNFLQDEMIDVGEGSYPVFFDYDGDSLSDLFIGNYYYYSLTVPHPSSLALYRNTGTRQSPAFTLVTRDFANLSTLGLNGLYPAFGDLDGDGDADMLIGETDGKLYYFTNTAGPGNPLTYTFTTAFFDSIDVGQFSAPQLVDVNCDGKPDLLIGERGGSIRYFENTGTDSLARFGPSPTISEFGGIDVQPVCCTGYAIPFLTTGQAGDFQLLVGTESNRIYSYTNIDNNITGTFQLADSFYSGINEGKNAAISLADLDNDGKADMAVGNYAGGIALYKGMVQRKPKDCSVPPPVLPFRIKTYPNPVLQFQQLNLEITGLAADDKVSVDLYDAIGKDIYISENISESGTVNLKIPLDQFAAGIYYLKVSFPGNNKPGSSIQKIVRIN